MSGDPWTPPAAALLYAPRAWARTRAVAWVDSTTSHVPSGLRTASSTVDTSPGVEDVDRISSKVYTRVKINKARKRTPGPGARPATELRGSPDGGPAPARPRRLRARPDRVLVCASSPPAKIRFGARSHHSTLRDAS